ncbi:MAG: energy-coupling factor transporter transmembrane component T [Pseudomonadota bacterium]
MSGFVNEITVGGFVPGESVLHRLDPRLKLLGFVALVTASFATGNLTAAVPTLCLTACLPLLSGLGVGIWLSGLRRFRWMLGIAAATGLLLNWEGRPVCVAGHNLPFTMEGFHTSALFTLQLAEAIVLSLALTCTTSPAELTRACEYLAAPAAFIKVPVGELGLVMLLAMRFIPILQLELRNIMDAQRARGVDFDQGDLSSRLKNLSAIITPCLICAVKRADALASAMRARGYEPGRRRSAYKKLQFRRNDLVAGAVIALVIILPAVRLV